MKLEEESVNPKIFKVILRVDTSTESIELQKHLLNISLFDIIQNASQKIREGINKSSEITIEIKTGSSYTLDGIC